MIASKIFKRLHLSDDFWSRFNVKNKEIKKQVGLYQTESTDSANIISIAVNPKEYFEKYKDKTVYKKHKGLKRDTPGMNFEAYSQHICSLDEFCSNQKTKRIKQKHFRIIKLNTQMPCVKKTQFAGLNDKRLYFHDGIVSLPFRHFLLNKVRQRKENIKTEIQHEIQD